MKAIMMILSIVESPRGKKLIEKLISKNIILHFQTLGYGTAPTEMMDIFGIGSERKDVLLSFANEDIIQDLMINFQENFSSYSKYKGYMMIIRLSSMNRLTATILNQHEKITNEGEEKMKNQHHQTLIMISINEGISDEVMEVARKYGASGGTIIKGRLSNIDKLSELTSIQFQEERELIFILAPTKTSHEIMENVNQHFGLNSKAQQILWSIPVEKTYKI
ncbi:MAG: hypothetical protein ACI4U3_06195 [Traorella sp.]